MIESLSWRLMELADRKNAVYEAKIVTNGYLLDYGTVSRWDPRDPLETADAPERMPI